MSVIHTCDLCGREIDTHKPYVTVASGGDVSTKKNKKKLWLGGWVAHFHSSDDPDSGRDCYERFHELVDVVRAHASNLAALPVAEPWQIRQMRDRHRVPERDATAKTFAGIDLQPRARYALVRRGIGLDAVARMSDEELRAIDGIGPLSLRQLRRAIAARKERNR
jgi:hypothetical protein